MIISYLILATSEIPVYQDSFSNPMSQISLIILPIVTAIAVVALFKEKSRLWNYTLLVSTAIAVGVLVFITTNAVTYERTYNDEAKTWLDNNELALCNNVAVGSQEDSYRILARTGLNRTIYNDDRLVYIYEGEARAVYIDCQVITKNP